MRRVPVLLAATLLALPSACGGGGSGDAAASVSPVTVQITIADGKITPLNHGLDVAVGQEIRLVVDSDTDDEIHVHSSPEHEFEVKPGQGEVFTFSLPRPGTVEVESHEVGGTILRIEAR